MAFDFSQGTPTATPMIRSKKSGLEKVGGFLAPTLTGTIKDIGSGQAPSLRQLGGSALELGSYLIPGGAFLKGAKVASKGLRAATTISKATKKVDDLTSLTQGARQLGSQLKTSAKTGAIVGGGAGAMAGTGRALGEEDKSIPQALGEGVIGGGIGAIGGGLLAPTLTAASKAIQGTVGIGSNVVKRAQSTLNPSNRAAAVDDLTNSLSKSFVDDKPSMLNQLEDIAKAARRRGDTAMDEQTLLREVVEEGYMPAVEGEIGRFGDSIADAVSRRTRLAKGITELAKQVPITPKTVTPMVSLKQLAKQNLSNRTDVDIIKAARQLESVIKSLQAKYGKMLTPENLTKINVEMNKRTKAFREQFVQDVQNALGQATRSRMDDLAPGIRTLNAESGRLKRVIDTMDILNNKKIDPGFFMSGAGRFIGTVAAAGAGLSVGGPGGLVIAGLMAQFGSKAIANLVRQSRFNPKLQEIIRKGLRQDEKLLNKILGEAKGSDKAIIERIAGKKTNKLSTISKEKNKETVQKEKSKKLGDKGITTGKVMGAGALGSGTLVGVTRPSTVTLENTVPPETEKSIDPERLASTIMQLESSGGTNKANKNPGSEAYLYGLTSDAINELKRVRKLPEGYNKNDPQKVKEAALAYFQLMKERNPELSDAEIYVDKYWTQAKRFENPEEIRQKKINEFNESLK